MTSEESQIIAYLRLSPGSFFNRKEIARKACSRSEYEENPHWAVAPLHALVEQKFVVENESGHFKLSEDYKGG